MSYHNKLTLKIKKTNDQLKNKYIYEIQQSDLVMNRIGSKEIGWQI